MILDTDVLIDLQRGNANAHAWLASLTELPPVSGLAAMELKFGCRDSAELRTVTGFLTLFPIVWPTETDLEHALTDYPRLHLSHSLGLIDALIAATAIGLGEAVATFNRRHFESVPGLVTVQPYTR